MLAIASPVASPTVEEIEIINKAFRKTAGTLNSDIVSLDFGDRWFQALLDVEPSFDLPKAMASLKAVTSRALRVSRGGESGFWAQGYVAVTIGEPIDPAEAAARLEHKGKQDA